MLASSEVPGCKVMVEREEVASMGSGHPGRGSAFLSKGQAVGRGWHFLGLWRVGLGLMGD